MKKKNTFKTPMMENCNNLNITSKYNVLYNGSVDTNSEEEVKMVMRVNNFVGDHISAVTKDGNHFTESEARTILKIDSNVSLVKNAVGHLGNNVVIMGFKNKLTDEVKEKIVDYLMQLHVKLYGN